MYNVCTMYVQWDLPPLTNDPSFLFTIKAHSASSSHISIYNQNIVSNPTSHAKWIFTRKSLKLMLMLSIYEFHLEKHETERNGTVWHRHIRITERNGIRRFYVITKLVTERRPLRWNAEAWTPLYDKKKNTLYSYFFASNLNRKSELTEFDFIMLRPQAKMAPHKSLEHLGVYMTNFFQEHIRMQLYPLSFLEIRTRRFLFCLLAMIGWKLTI